jgi:cyclase
MTGPAHSRFFTQFSRQPLLADRQTPPNSLFRNTLTYKPIRMCGVARILFISLKTRNFGVGGKEGTLAMRLMNSGGCYTPHASRRTLVRTAITLMALLGWATLLTAQDQDFSKVEIKVTKVSGNIYLLQGSGGNIAASVGEDGIVIVDDQYAPLADKIAAALKGIGATDKPVRFVINTHYHGDHTGGNLPFATNGSTIIAQDNVRKRLETGGKAGVGTALSMDQKVAPKGALPIITFDHDVTVHLNGEDIRALHFPGGHTDGDAIVFFPKANVVHMGDDFVRYGYPFIDVNSGGSVQGMIAACDKVASLLPDDVKVIPGHGQIANLGDIRDYSVMLKETSSAVQAAINLGKTTDQMKKEKILAAWDKKYGGGFITSDLFIETLYNSLTNQKNAEYLKHN